MSYTLNKDTDQVTASTEFRDAALELMPQSVIKDELTVSLHYPLATTYGRIAYIGLEYAPHMPDEEVFRVDIVDTDGITDPNKHSLARYYHGTDKKFWLDHETGQIYHYEIVHGFLAADEKSFIEYSNDTAIDNPENQEIEPTDRLVRAIFNQRNQSREDVNNKGLLDSIYTFNKNELELVLDYFRKINEY